eukprot:TRINITY_DN22119_c0_g1_i1.p1 TRINITY_DN22119_c0_g1~~TRINITY_DN22119_c0_g1_i1.p1  ORF type:complete len:798 (+),score=82.07 TRINITY_DN22119_c0_g1_i1:104-2497(+)
MVLVYGFAFAAAAALGHSSMDALRKVASRRYTPFELLGLVGLLDAAFLSTALVLLGTFPSIQHLTDNGALAAVLVVSAALKLVCSLLYQRALQVSPLSVTVPYLAFTPALLILTSFVLLKELPSYQGMAGVFVVTLGGYLLALESGKSHGKSKSTIHVSPLPTHMHSPKSGALSPNSRFPSGDSINISPLLVERKPSMDLTLLHDKLLQQAETPRFGGNRTPRRSSTLGLLHSVVASLAAKLSPSSVVVAKLSPASTPRPGRRKPSPRTKSGYELARMDEGSRPLLPGEVDGLGRKTVQGASSDRSHEIQHHDQDEGNESLRSYGHAFRKVEDFGTERGVAFDLSLRGGLGMLPESGIKGSAAGRVQLGGHEEGTSNGEMPHRAQAIKSEHISKSDMCEILGDRDTEITHSLWNQGPSSNIDEGSYHQASRQLETSSDAFNDEDGREWLPSSGVGFMPPTTSQQYEDSGMAHTAPFLGDASHNNVEGRESRSGAKETSLDGVPIERNDFLSVPSQEDNHEVGDKVGFTGPSPLFKSIWERRRHRNTRYPEVNGDRGITVEYDEESKGGKERGEKHLANEGGTCSHGTPLGTLTLEIPEGEDEPEAEPEPTLFGILSGEMETLWGIASPYVKRAQGSLRKGLTSCMCKVGELAEPLKALRREEGSLLMLGCAGLFSLTSSIDKMGTHVSPSVVLFACLQRLVMAIPCVLLLACTSPHSFHGFLRSFPLLASISLCEMISVICYLQSLNTLLVSYSVATKRMNILISVIIGNVLFKETIWSKLPAIALMMLGMLLIIFA